MATFSYGLAKGLREPCSPYREAYYFGAPLNEPSADGWNCLPELVSQTTSFDLSTIPEGREVLVALLRVQNTPAGTLNFKAEWYRNRDNALLFTQPWSYQAVAGGWVYFYAYLGYVPWEINENGGYRVEFTVSGALSYFKVIQFTISGIPEKVEPEPIPRGAMGWISERFAVASGFFYQVYIETLDWVYPFWLVSDFFYALSQVCSDLSWDFSDFNEWVSHISDWIIKVLSWETIWHLILYYVPNLEDIRNWFFDWWGNVLTVVNTWWTSTMGDVLGLIDVVFDWVKVWIDWLDERLNSFLVVWSDFVNITWPQFTTQLSSLLAEWSTFITVTLPQLPNWLDVGKLITDTLKVWFPFYDDLVSLWSGIQEFFTDPEDWLYKSLDRIIERFW